LALFATLAAQHPARLYEHWHLLLPVKSERNRANRLSELRRAASPPRSGARSLEARQQSDAPAAAPLPSLLLAPLER
jgi:hypothetical protein